VTISTRMNQIRKKSALVNFCSESDKFLVKVWERNSLTPALPPVVPWIRYCAQEGHVWSDTPMCKGLEQISGLLNEGTSTVYVT